MLFLSLSIQFTVLVAEAGLDWNSPTVVEVFEKLDRSGDGLISPSEFEDLLKPVGWPSKLGQKLTALRESQLQKRGPVNNATAADGMASARDDSMDLLEASKLAQAFQQSAAPAADDSMDVKEVGCYSETARADNNHSVAQTSCAPCLAVHGADRVGRAAVGRC